LVFGIAANDRDRRGDIPRWLAPVQNREPSENDIHRRPELMAQGDQKIVLQAALVLRLFARSPGLLQQSLALARRLPFTRHVATDADHPCEIPIGVGDDAAPLGYPHQTVVGTDDSVIRLI